jgi:hypothetical protein
MYNMLCKNYKVTVTVRVRVRVRVRVMDTIISDMIHTTLTYIEQIKRNHNSQ